MSLSCYLFTMKGDHSIAAKVCVCEAILQLILREHLKVQIWSLCIPILLRIKVTYPTVAPAVLLCGLCGRSFSISHHHWWPPYSMPADSLMFLNATVVFF